MDKQIKRLIFYISKINTIGGRGGHELARVGWASNIQQNGATQPTQVRAQMV